MMVKLRRFRGTAGRFSSLLWYMYAHHPLVVELAIGVVQRRAQEKSNAIMSLWW
jgi:hypothetical protein